MNLAAAVKTYLEYTGGYDLPLHLSQFGLPKPEVERLFSAWDEDYQISRFMLLSREESGSGTYPKGMEAYSINDYEYTHVTFRSGIEEFLASA